MCCACGGGDSTYGFYGLAQCGNFVSLDVFATESTVESLALDYANLGGSPSDTQIVAKVTDFYLIQDICYGIYPELSTGL